MRERGSAVEFSAQVGNGSPFSARDREVLAVKGKVQCCASNGAGSPAGVWQVFGPHG